MLPFHPHSHQFGTTKFPACLTTGNGNGLAKFMPREGRWAYQSLKRVDAGGSPPASEASYGGDKEGVRAVES